MAEDVVNYLNGNTTSPMAGSLESALNSLPVKMVRAPAKEWAAALKGLVSRGQVKPAEVSDSEIEHWLGLQPSGPIERSAVLDAAIRRRVTIKEVTLGSSQYRSYSHAELVTAGERSYREVLYIGNAEVDNLTDRIEEIDWELEQFNFDLERLSSEPDALFRLTAERKQLMSKKPAAHAFSWSHFTQSNGKHGKNLIAHSRELVFGNTFLVEEIQSDWGQRGRMNDWKNIPKGPFVTDTKLWAGLVMRRLMQRAALNPSVEKFYWIRGSMRNGGRQVTKDKLDEFYLKQIGGIVDRVLAPAKQKCRLENLQIGPETFADVPCFDMTPEAREVLKKQLPLYSLSQLLPKPRPIEGEEVQTLLRMAQNMTGSVKSIRLVDHLYDLAVGREVAGRYINGLAQASLRAKDLPEVLAHECFHFGMDKLFSISEQQMVRRSFAPGTELNNRVKDLMLRSNDRDAFSQCSNPDEAAAYAFAYWSTGKFELSASPVRTVFEELRVLGGDLAAWFRRVVLKEKVSTPEELFAAFVNGDYAQYAAAKEPVYRAPEVHRSELSCRE